MGDIAIVVCQAEENKVDKKTNMLERIILWLRQFFSILKSLLKKEEIMIEIKKNQVYDGINLCILILPFNIEELRRMGKKKKDRVDSTISNIAKESNIGGCLFPVEIYEALQPDSGMINLYTGDILYKALIKNTLKELYKRSGKILGELEFCIIYGENKEELISIVNLFVSEAKYVTVVVKDKEIISDEMDAISCETGVPVIVSKDMAGSVKKADVVVFLETAKDIVCPRLSSRTVIIDLNRRCNTKRRMENTIIKGIQIKLPLKQFIGIDRRAYTYFDILTIAEIILTTKVSGRYFKSPEEYAAGYNDNILLEELPKEFVRAGCSIYGIEGNNSMKKISDIKM